MRAVSRGSENGKSGEWGWSVRGVRTEMREVRTVSRGNEDGKSGSENGKSGE